MNAAARALVGRTVELLVSRRFDELEQLSSGVRLRAEHIRDGVADYPGTLVTPPSVDEELDVLRIQGTDPPAWSVNCRLWTKEEGPSDLTLELTVREHEDGSASVEIDGIRVL